MKDDTLYIEQILDAIGKIESFVADVTFDGFTQNQEKQSAIILQLAMIGELSKRISEDFKKHTPLPWKEIAGFRDRAIHDYFSLDIEQVWKTIEEDIPMLKGTLQKSRAT